MERHDSFEKSNQTLSGLYSYDKKPSPKYKKVSGISYIDGLSVAIRPAAKWKERNNQRNINISS